MKFKKYHFIAFTALALLFSCRKDRVMQAPVPILSTTVVDLTVLLNQPYRFAVGTINPDPFTSEWKLDGVVVSSTDSYEFTPKLAGSYSMVYTATNSAGVFSYSYKITVPVPVIGVTPTSSKYISKVFDYLPAPGQFINETLGSLAQAQKLIGSTTNILSLGGFGGYVVFGFDHSVVNRTGYDLAIYGNPSGAPFHFSEPGIVMVSQDANGNGLPDDEWYELAGSEYAKATTFKNYEITYTNPNAFANVPWTDNQGNSGVLLVNNFHKHNFYPLFAENQTSITFKGTLLPSTVGKSGSIIISSPYEWGYSDSYSISDDYKTNLYNSFDLSWAVDGMGKKVNLSTIDFVKVYTGQNADGGSLGEISTEIKGASDLNIK